MKKFKRKLAQLKIMAIGIVVVAILSSVLLLFNFGSGLAITDYMDGNDERNSTPIRANEEDILIKQLDDETLDDEFLNNMYFSKENFRAMLEAIQEAKESYPARESDVYYEYYYELWHKVPVPAIYDIEGNLIKEASYTWQWDYGVEQSTEPIHFSAEAIEQNREVNPFGLYWQPIYALCQMQSLDMYDSKYAGWLDDQDTSTGDIIIEQRLDMETVYEAINVFNMQFAYVWDGAACAAPEKIGTTDISKVDTGAIMVGTPFYDETTGETVYEYLATGERLFKWGRGWDGSLRNGGRGYENICYQVETYEENAPDGNRYEKPDGSANTIRNGEDFWEYEPPESDEWDGYRRVYKKIPATVLAQSYNGYSSHKWYTSENEIQTKKFHYKFSNICERSDDETDWSQNQQTNTQIDYIDVEKFYQACKTVCSSFDWEEFLLILETLPESETLVDFYTQMYEEWKAYTGAKLYEARSIDDPEFTIGNNVIIGKKLKKKFDKADSYYMPGFGDYDEDGALNTTLCGSDGLSYDDFYNLVTSYPGILANSDSVYFTDTKGFAQALYDIQEKYDVSAVGLFAIACLESGWGTSDICRDKGNFVGWQAYDNSPYSSSKDFLNGNIDYAGGLYQCLELITKNYILKGQDTYYKMRYNGGVHQYCTSTSWPHENALIRAKMEKFLGINRFSLNEGFDVGTLGDRDYQNPLGGVYYRVSDRFGYRDKPIEGASTYHKGIDLAGCGGKPVMAMADGVVIRSIGGDGNAGGYRVVINHGNWIDGRPTYTVYMHMRAKSLTKHNQEFVKKGEIIGTVGNTGVGTGEHLHFEIWLDEYQGGGTVIDPESVFDF